MHMPPGLLGTTGQAVRAAAGTSAAQARVLEKRAAGADTWRHADAPQLTLP